MPGRLNTLLRRIPKESKCLGFSVSDLDLSFKKSQMQWTAYYKPNSLTDMDENMT